MKENIKDLINQIKSTSEAWADAKYHRAYTLAKKEFSDVDDRPTDQYCESAKSDSENKMLEFYACLNKLEKVIDEQFFDNNVQEQNKLQNIHNKKAKKSWWNFLS